MTTEEILKKLVSFPVLGGESNLSIINWIEKYLIQYGIKPQLVYNEAKTKASLFCRFGPALDNGVILSGHTDVVPVEGQDWDSSPFVLTDKNDGKLYGRGSCDMKAFVASCLAAVPKLAQTNLKKPVYFALSYDEEIGCLGAPELIIALLNHYTEKPAYAIIGEPSLMQPIVGHKGICLFDTYVTGSAGHSSGILKEVSAVHESARLILWLEEKMKSLAEKSSDDRFTPPHTSIHVGQINSGIAPNVIADKAHFAWDTRVIPQDSLQEIYNDFNTYCNERMADVQKRFPDFKITTHAQHHDVPALDTKEDASIVRLLHTINPTCTHLGTVAYAAEAGQFSAAGIESIICGPGSIDQAHRANEFIAKSQLKACDAMLEKLIHHLSE